jgi:hypothetical protein
MPINTNAFFIFLSPDVTFIGQQYLNVANFGHFSAKTQIKMGLPNFLMDVQKTYARSQRKY